MWTPLFEVCGVRCGSKNGHYEDVCLKEIQLRAQIMLTILGLIFNIIGGDLDAL